VPKGKKILSPLPFLPATVKIHVKIILIPWVDLVFDPEDGSVMFLRNLELFLTTRRYNPEVTAVRTATPRLPLSVQFNRKTRSCGKNCLLSFYSTRTAYKTKNYGGQTDKKVISRGSQ
jgi:hypothetical protein